MAETRKLAAISAADVVGYSRLTGADEDRTLARLRALRSDLIDPTIAVHHGRVVKRTGDGALVEFRSVVDAVRCAIEVQNGMVERNAGLPAERRIEFRIGIHLGDVVEESDGDLMGDGVNIAARLEGIAKPGTIFLSEDAYRQVKARLDLAVTDLGSTQLKNIAEPVRVYSLEVGVPAQAKPAPHAKAPRLSIVVLPFTNIGDDPEQEYFVDGVTESLTTDLSRISGSLVIARNTAFTYKGKHVDVKQIGRDLGVRYVLEGSVQRGGNRLRINVQLIDAETGNHLWAQRFDKPVADLFDMQDEIVARLANELNAELIALEARRAEQSPNPDSMDLYFQGMAWANKGVNPEYFAKARACFERALALDPANVDGLVGQARIDAEMVGGGLADDRAARLASAEAALNKALSLAPNYPWAHTWMGLRLSSHQSWASGDCRSRAGLGAGSEFGARSSWRTRRRQNLNRPRRGSRRACPRGRQALAARQQTPYLGDVGRSCQALSRRGRSRGGVAASVDRGQSEFSVAAIPSSLRPSASRPARSRARGGAGGTGTRSGVHQPPLPHRTGDR